jgi:hypothetical protein
MCIKTPTTRAALLEVFGVGEVKAARYGERFLKVISSFLHGLHGLYGLHEQESSISEQSPGQIFSQAIGTDSGPAGRSDPETEAKTVQANGIATETEADLGLLSGIKPVSRSMSEPADGFDSASGFVSEPPGGFDHAAVEISDEPVLVSIIADRINCVLIENGYQKISGRRINDWLVSQAYLAVISESGKNIKLPTQKGETLGVAFEERFIRGVKVKINLFGRQAQEYIVSNALDILK